MWAPLGPRPGPMARSLSLLAIPIRGYFSIGREGAGREQHRCERDTHIHQLPLTPGWSQACNLQPRFVVWIGIKQQRLGAWANALTI